MTMRLLATLVLLCSLSNIQSQCIENELIIQITPDNYPDEITWSVTDANNVELGAGNYQSDTLCIPDGCVTFTIDDSYGDGLLPPGGYLLIYNGDTVRYSFNTNYGFSESTQFGCAEGEICDNAIPITQGYHQAAFDNSWFTFTPDSIGTYQISTCDSNTCNTAIYVYETCNAMINNEDNEGTLFYDNNQGGCGMQAVVNAYMDEGVTYYIRIGDVFDNCVDTVNFWITYEGPVVGCMDTNACNFNPLASVSGDCYYPGDPECPMGPDLKVLKTDVINSFYLTNLELVDECMVQEKCVNGFGTREIIRFDTHIDNIGDEDYFIGTPSTHPEQFSFDNCHGHTHYKGYAEYILYNDQGEPIPVGFKSGFCVMDLICDTGTAKYGCGNMGITAGCGDIYHAGLDCQWIDVTDVEDGDYNFIIRTNWDQSPDALGRYETDYTNNSINLCFSIDRSSGNTIVNLDANCDPFVDCEGVENGDAVPDCNGDCNGGALQGDVDQSGAIENDEPEAYVSAILNQNVSVTPCNDLSGDDALTVFDAALMNNCLLNSDMESTCDFGLGVIRHLDTVIIGIDSINFEEDFLILSMLNPSTYVNAIELNLSNVNVTGAVSLISNLDADITFEAQGNGAKLVGIGYDGSAIDKQTEAFPFVKVFFTSTNIDPVCIDTVISVVNDDYYQVIGLKEEACFEKPEGINDLEEMGMVISPNPSNGMIEIRGNGLAFSYTITNAAGQFIQKGIVSQGQTIQSVDLSRVEAGVYFVKVQTSDAIGVQSIVIQ